MNNRYSPNMKVCATCNFWTGQRTTNSTRHLAECVPHTKGDCHEGGVLRRQKPNNAGCNKWEKWSALKDTSSTSTKSPKLAGRRKKGIIPYPVLIGLVILVGAIEFMRNQGTVFIVLSVGIVLVIGAVIGFIFYRKKRKKQGEFLYDNG